MPFGQSRAKAALVLDDAAVDTASQTGKLVMGILALIAEFETAIRHELEGIARPSPKAGLWPRASGESFRSNAKNLSFSVATVQTT